MGDNFKIRYVHRASSRARRMCLAVCPDGSVRVTRPRWVPKTAASQFAQSKIKWILSKLEKFADKDDSLLGLGRSHYLRHRRAASEFIADKVRFWNRLYGFDYGRICVRNQKTRWGSCSQKGSLNFNYKLAFIPEGLADYVVAHELCHLKEMNHSKDFWSLVARAVPGYRQARKELKKYLI